MREAVIYLELFPVQLQVVNKEIRLLACFDEFKKERLATEPLTVAYRKWTFHVVRILRRNTVRASMPRDKSDRVAGSGTSTPFLT